MNRFAYPFAFAMLIGATTTMVGCEDDAGDDIEEIGDDIGDAADDAADNTEDAMDDIGDEAEDAVN